METSSFLSVSENLHRACFLRKSSIFLIPILKISRFLSKTERSRADAILYEEATRENSIPADRTSWILINYKKKSNSSRSVSTHLGFERVGDFYKQFSPFFGRFGPLRPGYSRGIAGVLPGGGPALLIHRKSLKIFKNPMKVIENR